jgi:hypothetical protein
MREKRERAMQAVANQGARLRHRVALPTSNPVECPIWLSRYPRETVGRCRAARSHEVMGDKAGSKEGIVVCTRPRASSPTIISFVQWGHFPWITRSKKAIFWVLSSAKLETPNARNARLIVAKP